MRRTESSFLGSFSEILGTDLLRDLEARLRAPCASRCASRGVLHSTPRCRVFRVRVHLGCRVLSLSLPPLPLSLSFSFGYRGSTLSSPFPISIRAPGESERIPWPPRPRPTNTFSRLRDLGSARALLDRSSEESVGVGSRLRW